MTIATDVLTSEWTKIRSVRSTYWTLFAAAATTIGLSAIVCAVYVAQYDHLTAKDKVGFNPASMSLTGGILAQLAIAVLGVLVITGEYGSGMIRSTFAAVPQRLTVLAAKATVFTAVTVAVTTTACFAAFFIGQGILSAKGIGVSLGSPEALRTVVGTGLYLAILGLLALGLGTLIRKTAGAITAVVGILFVLPVLSQLLPSSMDAIRKYLPSNAGQAIVTGGSTARGGTTLSPWLGLGVFFLYAAAALGAAAFTLVRRDA
ncbi:MAG TPA: ABC transporter permease subunit [Acidimicrobiia bacterium]|nr:ABC transporter permease subunit [Acidimicrobiia bacterium]